MPRSECVCEPADCRFSGAQSFSVFGLSLVSLSVIGRQTSLMAHFLFLLGPETAWQSVTCTARLLDYYLRCERAAGCLIAKQESSIWAPSVAGRFLSLLFGEPSSSRSQLEELTVCVETKGKGQMTGKWKLFVFRNRFRCCCCWWADEKGRLGRKRGD